MSGLTKVNQRSSASTSASVPSPVLLPPSGPSSRHGSPFQPNNFTPSALGGLGPSFVSGSGTASNSGRPGSAASQYSESPYGGGMSSQSGGSRMMGGSGSGYSRTAFDLETQNDERLDGLLGKVKMLKDITVGIGNEVRDGNLELSTMNDAFSSTTNFLGGTFKRMTNMARRQGFGWCWFMGFMVIVFWIFIIVWWLRR